jgi:hypothetical protein
MATFMRGTTVLTLVGAGVFTLATVSLHVLRPDISPVGHGISRYAGGDTMVLTSLGFVALAVALLALRPSIHVQNLSARSALAAAACGLIAVTLTPIGNPPTSFAVEALHSIGGLLFYVGVTAAMFLAASDARDRLVACLMSAALTLFLLGGAGTPVLHSIVGLLQRAVFAVAVYWIARSALRWT